MGISAFRNSNLRFTRVICFLFAVHLFNFSIDPRDREPDYAPEDLSFNEIESISEFMGEVVFGFDNLFEEHDEADENGGSADFCKIFYISQTSSHIIGAYYESIDVKYYIKNASRFAPLAKDITSPPPKA